MSVTFGARDAHGKTIPLDDPATFLNVAEVNAVALLGLLRLPQEYGAGETTVPEARRAVIRARATFDRQSSKFVRPPAAMPRVHGGAIDRTYLARRLEDFAKFVELVARAGAVTVHWG